MKKTLLALALAASAVSGMANAWTTGNFSGSVDIGGTITPENYKNNWQWQIGTGLNTLDKAVSQMTKGATELSIPVAVNQPLVMGQTTKAFSTPVSVMGAIPVLGYKDSDGADVTLTSDAAANHDGKVYFILPIKDDTNTKIGSLRVNATVAGVALGSKGTGSNLFSVAAAGYTNAIFSNGIPGGNSLIAKGSEAAAVSALFGNLAQTDMVTQMAAVDAGSAASVNDMAAAAPSDMASATNAFTSAAYTLGMTAGQTFNATFNNAIESTTKWSAPLTVTVTYL